MAKDQEFIKDQIKHHHEQLEDAGLRPDRTHDFLTALAAQEGFDLAYRLESTPRASEFLQSYHTGHSEALQRVRADDLMLAMHNDLHQSRLNLVDVYQEEKKLLDAGKLDDEDLAMTETLGRRIKGIDGNIMKLANMRDAHVSSFEKIKGAAEMAKTIEQSNFVDRAMDNSRSL